MAGQDSFQGHSRVSPGWKYIEPHRATILKFLEENPGIAPSLNEAYRVHQNHLRVAGTGTLRDCTFDERWAMAMVQQDRREAGIVSTEERATNTLPPKTRNVACQTDAATDGRGGVTRQDIATSPILWHSPTEAKEAEAPKPKEGSERTIEEDIQKPKSHASRAPIPLGRGRGRAPEPLPLGSQTIGRGQQREQEHPIPPMLPQDAKPNRPTSTSRQGKTTPGESTTGKNASWTSPAKPVNPNLEYYDPAGNTRTPTGYCFNCRSRHHRYPDCPKPRSKFCYWCGQTGVTLSSCPRCQLGHTLRAEDQGRGRGRGIWDPREKGGPAR